VPLLRAKIAQATFQEVQKKKDYGVGGRSIRKGEKGKGGADKSGGAGKANAVTESVDATDLCEIGEDKKPSQRLKGRVSAQVGKGRKVRVGPRLR